MTKVCIFIILLCANTFAQRLDLISSICPNSRFLTSQVNLKNDGNIYYDPCTNGSSVFTGTIDLSGTSNLFLPRTITTGTGAQIINKPQGTVNFAAGAITLTVTNNLANANSFIFTSTFTNDATCTVKDIERSNGSFLIRMTAMCSAETAVAFWVTN